MCQKNLSSLVSNLSSKHKGYFVTATGTDVGKTFITGLLVKKWRDSGIDAGYYKAALSGAELRDGKWIAGDADYVKRIAGGGIICPIRYDDQKIFLEDIIKTLKLPLLIVTTAALGSINACVLTVEYARSRGLDIRGIIVNRYGCSGNFEMEDDNIRMMQDLTGLEILAKVKDGDSDLGVQIF